MCMSVCESIGPLNYNLSCTNKINNLCRMLWFFAFGVKLYSQINIIQHIHKLIFNCCSLGQCFGFNHHWTAKLTHDWSPWNYNKLLVAFYGHLLQDSETSWCPVFVGQCLGKDQITNCCAITPFSGKLNCLLYYSLKWILVDGLHVPLATMTRRVKFHLKDKCHKSIVLSTSAW